MTRELFRNPASATIQDSDDITVDGFLLRVEHARGLRQALTPGDRRTSGKGLRMFSRRSSEPFPGGQFTQSELSGSGYELGVCRGTGTVGIPGALGLRCAVRGHTRTRRPGTARLYTRRPTFRAAQNSTRRSHHERYGMQSIFSPAARRDDTSGTARMLIAATVG